MFSRVSRVSYSLVKFGFTSRKLNRVNQIFARWFFLRFRRGSLSHDGRGVARRRGSPKEERHFKEKKLSWRVLIFLSFSIYRGKIQVLVLYGV